MSRSDQQEKATRRGFSSTTWAIVLATAIGLWLYSGQFSATSKQPEKTATIEKTTEPASFFKVTTRTLKATPRPASLVIRGQTKSPARVQVRAETPGVVETISKKKGQQIKKGDLLCQLQIGARKATLAEANGALSQALSDFESSNKLSRRGFAAVARKNADKARLDAAKAARTRAELDLDRIEIRAPFSGTIEEQHVKPGDYLRQADPCATLVQLDPILLTGAVSERDLAKVSTGMSVDGTLVTGQSVTGKITFISPSSDPTTRTFMFEASVSNPKREIRAGVTADITIGLSADTAHKLAASALSLSDNGQVGVKTVDTNAVARFVPVTILSNEKNAVWIAGLPETVTVITVGHEFVVDGQQVQAVSEKDAQVKRQADDPKA